MDCFGVFNQVSSCQEKRTENVKHSLSFSCQFEYTALWQAPLIAFSFAYFSFSQKKSKRTYDFQLN